MPEPKFMKLDMYIMTPEPISMAYSINPSHQSVCLHVCSPIAARQWLSIHDPGATNTRNKEELLEAWFSMKSVLCIKRVCGSACVSPYRFMAMAWLTLSHDKKEMLEAWFSVRSV
jgi:hypothetical protein